MAIFHNYIRKKTRKFNIYMDLDYLIDFFLLSEIECLIEETVYFMISKNIFYTITSSKNTYNR